MSGAAREPEARGRERVELEIFAPGELLLPAEMIDRLGLEAGDPIAVVVGRDALRLMLYDELRRAVEECVDMESAWSLADDFHRQPLTAVLAGGRLPIPQEVVAVEIGERWVLEVVEERLGPVIFLLRIPNGA
jgi:hypothetical protein